MSNFWKITLSSFVFGIIGGIVCAVVISGGQQKLSAGDVIGGIIVGHILWIPLLVLIIGCSAAIGGSL